MKAAIIERHGPPESILITEKPMPLLKDTQVLVRVKACGINHLDIWVRRGVAGHKFPLPMVPGSDITGIIEKTGVSTTRFNPGDRVIINPGISCGSCMACLNCEEHLCSKGGLLGETTDGGCQEFIAVEEKQVYLLPPNLTFEQGACIPINYVTAWQMLMKKAKIKSQESILIHAAGSGVSIACIQIAKMVGLQVYVTSSSEEKLQRAKVLGAQRFICTAKESFVEAIRNLTSKQGVDVVIDHVGGSTHMDSIRCLKRGGRLVSCGATAGGDITLNWRMVFFKNIALLGSTYGTSQDFIEVLKKIEEKIFFPTLDQTMKLEDLSKAHTLIENRKLFGKVAIAF